MMARAADLLREYEAKIAALERMVGRQALPLPRAEMDRQVTRESRTHANSLEDNAMSSDLTELGQEAITAVSTGVANGAPLVKCQLLASAFYEALRNEAYVVVAEASCPVICHSGHCRKRQRSVSVSHVEKCPDRRERITGQGRPRAPP